MTGRKIMWISPLCIYLLFVFWYTNTAGPLSEQEVETYISRLQANGSAPEQVERVRKFLEKDTGRRYSAIAVAAT